MQKEQQVPKLQQVAVSTLAALLLVAAPAMAATNPKSKICANNPTAKTCLIGSAKKA